MYFFLQEWSFVSEGACDDSKNYFNRINCEISRSCDTKKNEICTAFNTELQTFDNQCIYENSYCNLQPADKSMFTNSHIITKINNNHIFSL